MNMAGPIKVQVRDLMLKREDIEADVSLRSERLDAAGVGLHGSLLDKEVWSRISLRFSYLFRPVNVVCDDLVQCHHSQGYPRADIDIMSIRTDRQRIAGLNYTSVNSAHPVIIVFL